MDETPYNKRHVSLARARLALTALEEAAIATLWRVTMASLCQIHGNGLTLSWVTAAWASGGINGPFKHPRRLLHSLICLRMSPSLSMRA